MSTTTERLYYSLPAVYRRRDAQLGEPLRALCGILQAELDRVEGDIDQLYEDWFIETCREWVIPYIGDLLDVPPVEGGGVEGFSTRAYVANTMAYRRRKGTAAVLEQVARDSTGWPARASEGFLRLAVNAHLDHFRADRPATLDLRDGNLVQLLGGPLGAEAHSAEIRNIDTRCGQWNIANIGVHLWRMRSFEVEQVTARQGSNPTKWYVHPMGRNMPLYNREETVTELTHLAEETNLPAPLRKRALADELATTALADRHWLGTDAVVRIWIDGAEQAPDDITIMSLDDQGGTWPDAPASGVGLDPELGRIRLATAPTTGVKVTFSYGAPAELGGGPYDRTASVEEAITDTVTWQIGVSASVTGTNIVATLDAAIDAWALQPAGTVGLIVIMDNATRTPASPATKWAVPIPAGSTLHVVAADWPEVSGTRATGAYSADETRPLLDGDLEVRGTAAEGQDAGTLHLNGLLVRGRVTVLAGRLGGLRISHCSFVRPQTAAAPQAGLVVQMDVALGENEDLAIVLVRSVLQGVSVAETVASLSAEDCILDLGGFPLAGTVALDARGTSAELDGCTVLGESLFRLLSATDTLFADTVDVRQRQSGCVRFCYVPPDSRTPSRYKCQPDLATERLTAPAAIEAEEQRVAPRFVTRRYGDDDAVYPDYARLHPLCAEEIRTGSEDGAEIGAFAHLQGAPRLSNLTAALRTYLRFGMKAGHFFET